MTVHEEYVRIIEERYKGSVSSITDEWNYHAALNAPMHYKVEASMLDYVKKNKDASLQDVCQFFSKTAPIGLAPDDTGEDLLQD
jgi:hypothetical protein